jgi:hypothetical protein
MKYILRTEQEILDQFDIDQMTEEQMEVKDSELIEKYNREVIKMEMIFKPGNLATETGFGQMDKVAELIVTIKGE